MFGLLSGITGKHDSILVQVVAETMSAPKLGKRTLNAQTISLVASVVASLVALILVVRVVCYLEG
jgi:hypothetical protein